MNKTEYMQQRQALMAQVQAAKEKGDADTMNTLMDQVEELDAKFRDEAIQAANKRAQLLDQTGAPAMGTLSQDVTGRTGEGVAAIPMEQRTREDVLASAEYHSAFFKTLQGKTMTQAETKAMNMVVPAGMTAAAVSAAPVIPTETVRKIYGKLAEAPMLAEINILHIRGNVSIPVAGTVTDANWVAQATAATDGADTVTKVELAAYKLIKTLEITADLASMAIPEFESWLVEALSKKMRSALDKAVCVGTGSSQPTGLLQGSSITNAQTYTSGKMKFTELLAIIAALPAQYRANAKFGMPSALFFGQILGMTDTMGRPVVVSDPQAPAQYRILGYPVVLDENITADNGVFGDLKEGYTLNFGAEITVDSDRSVGFRAGSTVYRSMCEADGKTVDKTALVKFAPGA